jgi:hypothetical protein
MKVERADKLSISLTPELTAWLRRSAAKKGSNVSQVIREILMPVYDKRHAK